MGLWDVVENGETLDFYLDRVMEIVVKLRPLKKPKSDYEVIKKVLGLLSGEYDDVASLLEGLVDVKSMPLDKFVEFCFKYESITEEAIALMLKDLSLELESEKKNHNQEVTEGANVVARMLKDLRIESESKNNHRAANSGGGRQARPRTSECFLCGEQGHKAKDCKRKNQQQEDEEEEIKADYLRLAAVTKGDDSTYDEDMWMVSGNATEHVTRYEKFFTTLDKTFKVTEGDLSASSVKDVSDMLEKGSLLEQAVDLKLLTLNKFGNRFDEALTVTAVMAAANTQSPQVDFSDDLDYEVWAPRVKTRLVENGVWDVVQNGVSPDPTKVPELAATIKVLDLAQWRNCAIKDMKALKIIQSSLSDSAFRKSLSIASAKDLWDLLKKGNDLNEESNDKAKLLRLEKEFENLTMYEYESMDFYLDRVLNIVDQFYKSGNPKPDYQVIMKLLTSLSWEFEIVLPVLEEIMELPDMILRDLIGILELYGSHPGEYMLHELQDYYKTLKKAKSEQMWCGVCNKFNHNQVDCYYKPTGHSLFRGYCFRCREQGHRARACSNTNVQMGATHAEIEEQRAREINNILNQQTHAQIDEKRNQKPEHQMLSRLEKQFEELMMYEGESMENYLGRVMAIVWEFENLGNPKPDYEVIMKLLTSLSGEFDNVLPVLEDYMELPDMSRNDLIDALHIFGDDLQELQKFYISIKKFKSEQKWCGVCKKDNHNQVDCYYKPTGASQFRGHCFCCGKQGHLASDCGNTRNQQMMATHAEIDETWNEKPKHQMLTATSVDFTYDEDMWMLYTTSTDHMTPYVKFFTTLDRTYRAEVELGNGSSTMAEGKGDVMIMVKGVKVRITNVLFVPRINRNVLSFGKMAMKGYSMESSGGECTITDKFGKIFAQTRRDGRGIVLRLQVIR
ncbi:hypothetical protein AALP_AA3G241600 [Arabis alpina]|uniref:CCHC-type domain-containing protein n=1 Tax=Arabis alpina TaxID=50452 RepID=A0A087HBB1_ARAAL|nr:hypothetical protein AALP_AA3G241600 [Arabis alpina]